MKRVSLVVIITLQILVISCSNRTPANSLKDQSFQSLYPNCTMNSDVIFLPLQPNYKEDGFITVGYHNVSTTEIAFPLSSEVKLYTYDAELNTWAEIKNKVQYSTAPKPYIVLDASNDLSSYDSVSLAPVFTGEKPEEIRVAITGYVYKDGAITDDCLSAFIDLAP
jgi:hypothetical protein